MKTMGVDYGGYDPKEQISKYFKLGEFLKVSNSSIPNIPTPQAYENLKQLAAYLDILRQKFGAITVTSGYRSPDYQKYLKEHGGEMEKKEAATYSYHQEGIAADITPLATPATKVYAAIVNDPTLNKIISELAIKENTIHLAIDIPPSTKHQWYAYVTEAGKYVTFKADELSKFIKANLGTTAAIGFGFIALVAGGLATFLYIRKKRSGK